MDDAMNTRRQWLKCCAGTTAGLSLIAGCMDSDETDEDESPAGTGNGDAPTAGAWPMYGVDPQNTGHHPTATGPKGPDVTVETLYQDDAVNGRSPVIVDDVLYATAENRLLGIDVSSGAVTWQCELDASPTGHPAIDDAQLYVSVDDEGIDQGWVSASADSEDVVWANTSRMRARSPVPVDDGAVATAGPSAYQLAAESGDETEIRNLSEDSGGEPLTEVLALADDTLFFAKNHVFYAVNRDTGEIEWSFENPAEESMYNSDPAVVDGTVYVGGENGTLYAFDADAGTEEWSLDVDPGVECSPSIADGTLYFGSAGAGYQRFAAVDVETGEYVWGPEEVRATVAQKPVVADGVVYVVNYRDLVAYDAATGDRLWDVEGLETPITAVPAVADGALYAIDVSGAIQKIE